MIIYGIILLSSIWVYFDAKKIGARKGLLPGFFNLGPVMWLLACLLLWIIGFPSYLVMRSRIIEAAAQESGESNRIVSTGVKQSGLNTFAKIVAIGWTLLFAILCIGGLASISEIAPPDNEFETAGYAIGATLGFGLYFLLWIAVAVPAAIVFLVTRKSGSLVIVEQPRQSEPDRSKNCPYCAEKIKMDALFCRFCNKELAAATPPLPPSPKIEQKPEPPKTDWLARGKDHLKNGEFKEAVSACTMAIKQNAGGEELYLRAVAYSKMKDHQRMRADLEAAARVGHLKSIETLGKLSAKA
ncbi:MAG: hypothetical protein VR65_24860 [Desulfobulbaceae bacterium BRH_c16a]|nr:MAG: hypothetical protein VR65_24860 [Desulfobulbaceae bacterium BRH_c16a]